MTGPVVLHLPLPLRTCGRCSGHHLGHDSTSLGGVYFCSRCLPVVMGVDLKVGDAVRFIDGDQRDWRVIGRDGDVVTLRRPGAPDVDVSVHTLWCPEATRWQVAS